MVVTSDKHHYLTNLNRTLPKCAVSFPTLRKKTVVKVIILQRIDSTLSVLFHKKSKCFKGGLLCLERYGKKIKLHN